MALEGWVVDATAKKGFGGVQVGDEWVPRRFSVWAVKGYADINVGLTCSTDNGRSVDVWDCRLFCPDPDARITTSVLRQVPVAGLARLGMWSSAVRRNSAGAWERVIPDDKRHRWGDVTVWHTDGPPEEDPRTAIQTSDLDKEWVARLEKDYGKLVEAKRGVGVRTDEWWLKVERAYLDALENREPRGDAVAKAMNLSIQAAKNAITEARKRDRNLPKRGRVK